MKTNKYLVYPGHGPVRILKVESKEIGGAKVNLLTLECLMNKMKICVPEKDLEKKTRPLVSKADAKEIKKFLDDQEIEMVISTQTWNRRYRAAQQRLQDGNLKQIADVLKELVYLGKNKELSFGERKMKEVAKSLIDAELNLVLE